VPANRQALLFFGGFGYPWKTGNLSGKARVFLDKKGKKYYSFIMKLHGHNGARLRFGA